MGLARYCSSSHCCSKVYDVLGNFESQLLHPTAFQPAILTLEIVHIIYPMQVMGAAIFLKKNILLDVLVSTSGVWDPAICGN